MNDAPFFVEVITTQRNDPSNIVDSRVMNYNNHSARKWLAKHSNWALRKGYAVHTACKDVK